jgi:hypothetical protein
MAGQKNQGKTSAEAREARLKAALKANMGRRKAQARVRAAQDEADPVDKKEQEQE